MTTYRDMHAYKELKREANVTDAQNREVKSTNMRFRVTNLKFSFSVMSRTCYIISSLSYKTELVS